MLNSVRRTAVKAVKPWLSDEGWDRLCQLDPSPSRRAKRDARKKQQLAAPAAEPQVPLSKQDLPSLARHFGTDKWGTHRYAQHYETHLRRFKKDQFTLLEIGIGGYSRSQQGGASLRMWKAFFPKAEIFGLDIVDKSFVNERRITAFQGSQTNEPLLRTITDTATNLQVIIDDGSHRPEHIRETFAILFPLLETGGVYAIEDLQTSYWPRWGGSFDLQDRETSMALVKDLVDGINYEEWQHEGYIPSYSDLNIQAIHVYHNLVIIEKGPNHEGTNRNANWDKVS